MEIIRRIVGCTAIVSVLIAGFIWIGRAVGFVEVVKAFLFAIFVTSIIIAGIFLAVG